MRPIVPNKHVKFGGPHSNHSRQIPPEAVAGGIFNILGDYFRPDVNSDVISGVAVE